MINQVHIWTIGYPDGVTEDFAATLYQLCLMAADLGPFQACSKNGGQVAIYGDGSYGRK